MKLAAIVLALALSGCSVMQEKSAYGAVAADTATTAYGLTMPGIVEANPLGWITLPLSIAMIEHAKTLPPEEGVPRIHAITAGKWGVALSNTLLFLGAATPYGLLTGAILATYLWTDGQGEREFWAICAQEKITCEFKPFHLQASN